MELSVITTLYRSSTYIDEFYNRIIATIKEVNLDYEIVFVDDGSPDDSIQKVLKLQEKDPKIKLVELSRNFGHHKAVLAGLNEAKGDLVYLLDIDLEEKPENLLLFKKNLDEKEVDVVYGILDNRKGNWSEKLFGYLFYTLINKLSYIKIPRNITMTRLMNRNYVDALLEYSETDLFLGHLFHHVGFKQLGVKIEKVHKGSSTYNFSRKIQLLIDAIVSSSEKLLIYIFYFGIFVSLASFVFSMVVFYRALFMEVQMGWPSLILSIWMLGGIIIVCIGILGIYISKVYKESKSRPRVIIRKKHFKDEN